MITYIEVMMSTKTDLSHASTITVCELFLEGVLEKIPENHIFVIFKKLTYQMKRKSSLGEDDPAIKAYVEACLSDMEMTVHRYLKLARSKHSYYRTWYMKNRCTKDRREMLEGRHLIRADTLAVEYYEDVAKYKVGVVSYEGYELEIYYNVPVKTKHRSLTCFHTNPITMNHYYFKNLYDILPSDELREQFELQLQLYQSLDSYEHAD